MSSLRPLRIVTRCSSVDEFVAYFGPLADEQSVFMVVQQPLEEGSRHPFSVVLGDGAPVLMGEGEVSESQPAAMRWRVLSLDETSRAVHARMLAVRDVGALPPPPEQMTVTLRLETALFQPAPAAMAPPWSEGSDASPPPIPPGPPGRIPTVPPDAFGKTPPPEPIGPRRPQSQFSTNEERAWYDDVQAGQDVEPAPLPRPPTRPGPSMTGIPAPADVVTAAVPRAPISNRDEYADPVGRPRSFWIAIGGTAAGALLVGLFAGWLIWSGGTKTAPTTAASTTGGDLAMADKTPPGRDGSAAAARAARPSADQPTAEDPAGDGDGERDAEDGARAPGPAPVALGGDCVATFRSEPPDADVTVGGKPAGKTPLEGIAVPCGTLVVTLDRPRYERIERRLEATAGTPAQLDERLVRPEAVLELTSTPPGATMSVDGHDAGSAPASAKVRAFGKVTVKASLAGYKPWTQKVYVKGRKQRVVAKLEKATPVKPPPKSNKRPGR